ncbi:MAG: TRAP transporter substrate-binding protein [Cellulosilyticaceae bacterium]
MLKRKLALLLSGLAVTSMVLMGCSTGTDATKATVLRVAHVQGEDHPQHAAMLEFEKYVEEKTNGEIDVQVFPNELLGPQRQTVELTQTGAIDFVIASVGLLEAFESRYTVFNLPYLFDSREHYFATMEDQDIIGEIFNATEQSGFVGLTWFDAGTRNVYTVKKPVMTPDDMKGLKIRVQSSPVNLALISALGASPTPMSFGEVYTALQQSVIDGAENNELALTNNKHGEVAPYYSYTQHGMIPDILIGSKKTLDRLTPEQQQVIFEASEVANAYEIEKWAESVEKAKAQALEMGVQFNEVDIEAFQAKVLPIHEQFLTTPGLNSTYEKIREKAETLTN